MTVLIGLVPTIALSALGSAFLLWTPLPPDVLDIVCNQENKFTRPCFPELYRLGSLELAAIIFSCTCGYAPLSKLIQAGFSRSILGYITYFSRFIRCMLSVSMGGSQLTRSDVADIGTTAPRNAYTYTLMIQRPRKTIWLPTFKLSMRYHVRLQQLPRTIDFKYGVEDVTIWCVV